MLLSFKIAGEHEYVLYNALGEICIPDKIHGNKVYQDIDDFILLSLPIDNIHHEISNHIEVILHNKFYGFAT